MARKRVYYVTIDVSAPGFFEVMYSMRAMRRVKPDPVPEELLLKLIEAATQAPSGGNNQPWRFILMRDRGQMRQLGEIHRAAAANYKGLAAQFASPDPAVRASAERRHRSLMYQANHFDDTPALIVVCAVVNPELSREGRRAAAGAVWPAVQNLLLAARALGLAAMPSGFSLSNRDRSREILGLPDNVEALIAVPVGYPMGKFGPVSRRPVSEVTHFDRWSE